MCWSFPLTFLLTWRACVIMEATSFLREDSKGSVRNFARILKTWNSKESGPWKCKLMICIHSLHFFKHESIFLFSLVCTLYFRNKNKSTLWEIWNTTFPVSPTQPLTKRRQKLSKNGAQTFVMYVQGNWTSAPNGPKLSTWAKRKNERKKAGRVTLIEDAEGKYGKRFVKRF
jgi:hypothetical protein